MDQLPELLIEGDIFMQDNPPVHRAHIIRNLLKELGLSVTRDYPELQNAPDNDQTLYCLIQAAKEAWDSVEERILKNSSNTIGYVRL